MKITEKICVKKPYYALINLEIKDTITAEISVENQCHFETSSITAAEAGRHSAILGSCALASINNEEGMYYYLAIKAIVENHDKLKIKSNDLILKAKDYTLDLKGKKGEVSIETFDQNQRLIYRMKVNYLVLKKDIFQKLNNQKFILDKPKSNFNPYTQSINLVNIEYSKNKCQAEIGEILQEMCIGHFENYPALPVAILSDCLIKLAGKHLNYLLNTENNKYSFRNGILTADAIAFVGDYVKLTSRLVDMDTNNGYQFTIDAINKKNEVFSSLTLNLTPSIEINELKTEKYNLESI